MRDRYLLFDFDGVIVDTFAIAFEVQKLIYDGITEDDYKTFFEENINERNKTLTHSKLADNFHPEVDFFTEYIPKFKEEARVFEGITEVIKQLSENYSLIIISSTITTPIQEFLEKNNLTSYFVEVMGNDVHKSKIEKIKMVFAKYKTDSSNCVFITDTLGDLREASKVEVKAIAVSWGFHNHEILAKGSPYKIIDKPEELVDAVSDLFDNPRCQTSG